jgi:hypothetical protein
VNGSNAYVCTYSGDQLTMFIALGGEVENSYQQCVFVRKNNVWRINDLVPPIESESLPNCWQERRVSQ